MINKLIYLLDENVLINSCRDIYPPKRIPEFWAWLGHRVGEERIRTLKGITKNLKHKPQPGRPEDELSLWIRDFEQPLWLEDPDENAVRRVLHDGYEVASIEDSVGGDPNDVFLIAAASVAPEERVVVTMEDPHRRAKKGRKRRIPHVCERLRPRWATPYELLRELDFRTSEWRVS